MSFGTIGLRELVEDARHEVLTRLTWTPAYLALEFTINARSLETLDPLAVLCPGRARVWYVLLGFENAKEVFDSAGTHQAAELAAFIDVCHLVADLDSFLAVMESHGPAMSLAQECRNNLGLLSVLEDWCQDLGLSSAVAEVRYWRKQVRALPRPELQRRLGGGTGQRSLFADEQAETCVSPRGRTVLHHELSFSQQRRGQRSRRGGSLADLVERVCDQFLENGEALHHLKHDLLADIKGFRVQRHKFAKFVSEIVQLCREGRFRDACQAADVAGPLVAHTTRLVADLDCFLVSLERHGPCELARACRLNLALLPLLGNECQATGKPAAAQEAAHFHSLIQVIRPRD